MWCIPEITPDFREQMYDILDLYAEPYDPKRPVIGLDEKPKQLVEDSRKAIPMRPGRLERYDYEYVRKGSANIFMAAEYQGWKAHHESHQPKDKEGFCKIHQASG